MLKNDVYNLMETASQISKGLYRYDTFKKDAEGCRDCQQLWDEMRHHDEQQLHRIMQQLRHHFEKGEGTTKAA